MTWSTLPSQSQRADTGPIAKENEQAQAAADVDLKNRQDANENLERRDLELEDIIMESSKTTVSMVEVRLSSNLNLDFISPNFAVAAQDTEKSKSNVDGLIGVVAIASRIPGSSVQTTE